MIADGGKQDAAGHHANATPGQQLFQRSIKTQTYRNAGGRTYRQRAQKSQSDNAILIPDVVDQPGFRFFFFGFFVPGKKGAYPIAQKSGNENTRQAAGNRRKKDGKRLQAKCKTGRDSGIYFKTGQGRYGQKLEEHVAACIAEIIKAVKLAD